MTRPSTSIRMAGVDIGRCGAWVVMRRSASVSSRAVVVSYTIGVSGRVSGRVIRSAKLGASVRRARCHRDRMADARGAGAALEGLVGVRQEVSHPAHEREGRQALVVAQGRADDVLAELGQEVEVAGPRGARREAVADLRETPRADPAGDRLAPGLVGTGA